MGMIKAGINAQGFKTLSQISALTKGYNYKAMCVTPKVCSTIIAVKDAS